MLTAQHQQRLLNELDDTVALAVALRQKVVRDVMAVRAVEETDMEAALDLAARVEDNARGVTSLLTDVPILRVVTRTECV